jgi:hypothetical protein
MAAPAEMHHDIMFLAPVRSLRTLDVSCGISKTNIKRVVFSLHSVVFLPLLGLDLWLH